MQQPMPNADPNITDYASLSPLMDAAGEGNLDVVELLLAAGYILLLVAPLPFRCQRCSIILANVWSWARLYRHCLAPVQCKCEPCWRGWRRGPQISKHNRIACCRKIPGM